MKNWNERTFEEKVSYFTQQISEWKNRTKGYEVKELAEYIANDLEYALTSNGEDDNEKEAFDLDNWDLEDYEEKFLKENCKFQLWTKSNGDEFLISVYKDKNEAIKAAWELYDNRNDEDAEIRVYANDTDYDTVQYRLDIEVDYHSRSKGYTQAIDMIHKCILIDKEDLKTDLDSEKEAYMEEWAEEEGDDIYFYWKIEDGYTIPAPCSYIEGIMNDEPDTNF
jgi:hypothetical protein